MKKIDKYDEETDYLKQIDRAPNTEAEKDIVQDQLEEEIAQKTVVDNAVKDILQTSQSAKITYKVKLATYGVNRLFEVGFPDNWEYYCIPTSPPRVKIFGKQFAAQDGVLVILRGPKGEVYVRGIKMVYDAEKDFYALDILIVQSENTLDAYKGVLLGDNKDTEGTLKKTKSGIYLPD